MSSGSCQGSGRDPWRQRDRIVEEEEVRLKLRQSLHSAGKWVVVDRGADVESARKTWRAGHRLIPGGSAKTKADA